MPIFGLRGKYILFIHIPKCGGTSIENILKSRSDGMFLFCPQRADLPTAAQHFHRPLLEAVIPNIKSIISFAVVRHPVSRALSEYFHDTRRLSRTNQTSVPDFDTWMEDRLEKVERNPYLSDNHLRRQVEFILDNTAIFRFEEGLEAPVKFALTAIDAPSDFENLHEKNWKKIHSLKISKNTVNSIENYYESDMKNFGYTSVMTDDPYITYEELISACNRATKALAKT